MCFWIGRGIGRILEGYTSTIVKFLSIELKKEVLQTTEYDLLSKTPLKTVVFQFPFGNFQWKKKLMVCFFLYSILSHQLKNMYFLLYTSLDGVSLFSKQSYCVSAGIDLE